MTLYVGNLSYEATDDDLRKAFGAYGKVDDARVVMDRYTNQSRGFGFVDMSNDEEARAAIEAIDGSEIAGRAVRVSIAQPRKD
ncbi:MAG TPA: RNA-binding protein [Candidatus Hydrogenedentes bacterium]|nr:RNA-binding protein [Candidatus Hydrogenedentota bacterium]